MVAILILLALTSGSPQRLKSLDAELSRLHTNTAMVLPAGDIDDYPLWSPASNYLAANVAGKWYKVNLSQLSLKAATWRGKQKIGVLNSKSSVSKATAQEVAQWTRVSKFRPRALTTKAGTRIELRETDLGVTLIIRKPNQKAQKLWTSDMENCHSLVLSPAERYVAFICEANGVIVLKLND
jgi:hypothetical protein